MNNFIVRLFKPKKSYIAFIKSLYAGGVRFWEDDDEEQSRTESSSTTVQEPKFYATPEYPEATQARTDWAKKLTEWGQDGSYGANLPDYNAIFENAKKRINEYYWGGATSPGIIDKIKAGVAQRGVQDSPATGVLTTRMGAEEASKIGDISTNVDTQKAIAVEQARINWLNSLMGLSKMTPSGQWGGTTTQTGTQTQYAPATNIMDVLGTAGSGGMSLLSNYYSGKGLGEGLSSVFDLAKTSSGMPTSLKNPYGENYSDLTKMGLNAASMIPGPQQPFVAGANALSQFFY